MAGYMTKLNGNVYEGGLVAAADIANGLFAYIDTNGKIAVTTAAKDTKMRLIEKTTLYGMDAIKAVVTDVGADEIYFVEAGFDVNDQGDYDEAAYVTKANAYVRCHRPLIGEELIFTVGATTYAALAVGDIIQPTAAGTVAEVV